MSRLLSPALEQTIETQQRENRRLEAMNTGLNWALHNKRDTLRKSFKGPVLLVLLFSITFVMCHLLARNERIPYFIFLRVPVSKGVLKHTDTQTRHQVNGDEKNGSRKRSLACSLDVRTSETSCHSHRLLGNVKVMTEILEVFLKEGFLRINPSSLTAEFWSLCKFNISAYWIFSSSTQEHSC